MGLATAAKMPSLSSIDISEKESAEDEIFSLSVGLSLFED